VVTGLLVVSRMTVALIVGLSGETVKEKDVVVEPVWTVSPG
jgi:hypothetical protein